MWASYFDHFAPNLYDWSNVRSIILDVSIEKNALYYHIYTTHGNIHDGKHLEKSPVKVMSAVLSCIDKPFKNKCIDIQLQKQTGHTLGNALWVAQIHNILMHHGLI